MASHGLIDAYVESLHRRLRWRSDVDAVVAEVEDHLYSTAERFEASGVDPDLAQRAALERFGDADLVARAYAAVPNGGLAMPTESTRSAGTFAIVSGVLWLVVIGSWWLAGLTEPTYELQSGTSSISYAIGAAALIGATALMVAAMLGLDRRHGGLGAIGAAGLLVAGAGLVGSLLAWVFTGWGTLTTLGTVLLGAAMWRRNVAPRLPVALIASGPVAGAIAWAVLRSSQGPIDLSGLWGDHWFENEVGLTLGVVILAVGLLGMGRWLRSEVPALLEGPHKPVAG